MVSPIDAGDAEDEVIGERYLTRDGQDQDGSPDKILKARLLDGRIRKDWTGAGTDSAEGVSENLPSPDFYGHDSERMKTLSREPIDEV